MARPERCAQTLPPFQAFVTVIAIEIDSVGTVESAAYRKSETSARTCGSDSVSLRARKKA